MPESLRTLVVDDEAGIRFFLEETLRRAGHIVGTASSGEEALERLRTSSVDLILLDLRLGGQVDGLRVLEAVKWRWPETLVIILTAHGSLDSAMAAIHEGVDGYLLKPVKPEDVRRAVREALARRERLVAAQKPDAGNNVLQCGPFTVDLEKHVATRDGELLDLTPGEFNLLAHLIEHVDRVVPPPELVRVVRDYDAGDLHEAREIVKWYIFGLRRKVEPNPSEPRYILNVRGMGYRFGR